MVQIKRNISYRQTQDRDDLARDLSEELKMVDA